MYIELYFCSFWAIRARSVDFIPKSINNIRKLDGKYVGWYVSIFDELNLIYPLHFVRLKKCVYNYILVYFGRFEREMFISSQIDQKHKET